jgi:hypothetical protein
VSNGRHLDDNANTSLILLNMVKGQASSGAIVLTIRLLLITYQLSLFLDMHFGKLYVKLFYVHLGSTVAKP